MTQAALTAINLEPHELRAALLGELHTRPFAPIHTPRRIYHFGFSTSQEKREADRRAIEALCRAHGVAPPAPDANYHRVKLPQWQLRWEQHSEFTTYTWDSAWLADRVFASAGDEPNPLREFSFRQPGKLLVAVHMSLIDGRAGEVGLDDLFDPASLCSFTVHGNKARVSSDFQLDPLGFTRLLIEDHGLNEWQCGILTQRLLEIETYRIFALRALPVAKQITPVVRRIEKELTELTRAISRSQGIETDRKLLDRLIHLAAEIEAQSVETAYRFGASLAYYDIVNGRLKVLEEEPIDGQRTFSALFGRRLKPAMATVKAVIQRQDLLSHKLTRAADLLRTRIQFALEEQNRDLLHQMNRRARMQLRLQQTVEGLSVAAVSYYMVSLIGYLAKGIKDLGALPVPAEIIKAAAVPFVVLIVWLLVHHVRKSFDKEDEADAEAHESAPKQ